MIEIKRQDKTLTVYIDNQATRNAFTIELIRDIYSLDCNNQYIIIFTNKGSVFSSGLDLNVFLKGSSEALSYLEALNDMVNKLIDCEATTVAYLAGDAYGFGVEFTYFMDYVISARPDITLSLQGVRLGVFPPYTRLLSHVLGYAIVRLLLARPITAEEAKSLGLVHEIGDMDSALKRLFRIPAHTSRLARAHRELVRDALKEARGVLAQLASLADMPETIALIRSFLEKR